jgi:hypothetical protein
MVVARVIYAVLGALWLLAFVFFVHYAQTHMFLVINIGDDNVPKLSMQAQALVGQVPVSSASSAFDGDFAWRAAIFVNMAAYRDKMCHKTVWEAIARASNPARLHFGIFQQHNDTADPDCLLLEGFCPLLADTTRAWVPSDNPYAATRAELERACAVLPRIKIDRIDYIDAKGPTVGRFRAQEFIRDQDFYLQIDTHSLFVGGWDVELIVTWLQADDGNAVLTTYPRDAHMMPEWQLLPPPARIPSAASGFTVDRVDVVRNTSAYPYDPNVIYFPATVPVICSGRFLGTDMGRMAKFDAHTMLRNPRRPIPAPYFAAGFAFMPIAAVKICRYDPHTPMLFDGEELSYAVRLFTHGYNLYAPPTDTIYHKYETGENPKYWQVNWNARYFVQLESARRIAAVLSGTKPPAGASVDYKLDEFDRFGLGSVRTVQDYMAYSGVDIPGKTMRNVCNDITNGFFGARIKRRSLRV